MPLIPLTEMPPALRKEPRTKGTPGVSGFPRARVPLTARVRSVRGSFEPAKLRHAIALGPLAPVLRGEGPGVTGSSIESAQRTARYVRVCYVITVDKLREGWDCP